MTIYSDSCNKITRFYWVFIVLGIILTNDKIIYFFWFHWIWSTNLPPLRAHVQYSMQSQPYGLILWWGIVLALSTTYVFYDFFIPIYLRKFISICYFYLNLNTINNIPDWFTMIWDSKFGKPFLTFTFTKTQFFNRFNQNFDHHEK